MIPFWNITDSKRRPTLQENVRGFKIVGILLLAVAVAYIVIAFSIFGHL